MSTTATPTSPRASGGAAIPAQLAGEFMTFQLADEVHALESLKVVTVTLGILVDRVLEVLSIDAARNRHAASA